MNMAKRVFSFFIAFALCAVISLGSLSFMSKSLAVSPSSEVSGSFDFSSLPYDYIFLYGSSSSSSYFGFALNFANKDLSSFYIMSRGGIGAYAPSAQSVSGIYFSLSSDFSSFSAISTVSYSSANWGSSSSTVKYLWLTNNTPQPEGSSSSDVFYYSCVKGVSLTNTKFYSSFSEFVYSYSPPPLSSIPLFFDFQPFYFPEMPHGYFDGNINVVDGSYNIDFPSDASISGAITQTGNDHYTWTWNHGTLYWNGETVQGEHEGWLSPDYQHQTPPIGDISQTAYANRLINLSLSDLDSVVNYTPAYNENSRFRCWSCVMDSSYVWFVSDTRNKITGSIVSVTSNEVSWKYEFSDPQGGNTIYPTWAIVFSPMGEVIQVLSPSTVSNKNTYTLSCSIGTLEQDQDTGIWSCDPLYHGFWFSNDSPPVANISHLNVAENKKYLANPVFGDSAFQLQFLDSINRGIADINSNIQSLQSAMQSSISGQTSDFQNMDAPSAPQPSTSQMMDYFSKESAFSAPNTDEVFSGDIKSGHYWDGVTWWSSKFNDIIVSNQVIVAFTTAMLTLGLAVLIIGRRFSMR